MRRGAYAAADDGQVGRSHFTGVGQSGNSPASESGQMADGTYDLLTGATSNARRVM